MPGVRCSFRELLLLSLVNLELKAEGMMSDNRIAEWGPEHLDQVIDVIGRGLREQKVLPDSDEPFEDDDLYNISEDYTGRSRLWVFLHSGSVVGTVAIREMDATTASLKCMFVLAAYQGRGVGQLLLDHAAAFARAQNYKAIILRTHRLMKRAHSFYERNGFERVSEEGDLYGYHSDL